MVLEVEDLISGDGVKLSTIAGLVYGKTASMVYGWIYCLLTMQKYRVSVNGHPINVTVKSSPGLKGALQYETILSYSSGSYMRLSDSQW